MVVVQQKTEVIGTCFCNCGIHSYRGQGEYFMIAGLFFPFCGSVFDVNSGDAWHR